jgi:hypothetical protein
MTDDNKSASVESEYYRLTDSPCAAPKEVHSWGIEEPAKTTTLTNSPENEAEYPSMWKLIPITAGLCCCVFCMALVWWYPSYKFNTTIPLTAILQRITQSSQRLFRESLLSSIRLMTWAGMVALTC